MIDVVNRYFGLNRILLLMIGLWPYEKSKCAVIQIICVYSILISCIIFQLTTFFTSKCTAEFIIKILSITFAFCSIIVKYNAFYVNSRTIKYLIRQLHHIYNDLRDKNEIAIIERYGSKANCYTASLTLLMFVGASFFTGIQFWRNLKNVILSSNVSDSHQLPFDTEYFVDKEKYFYLIFLHVYMGISIGCLAILATGSMLLSFFQHSCGMLKIARKARNEILAHDDIARAVDMHRKTMTFATDLISSFEISLMFLILFGVLVLSLNIFLIFQILLLEFDFRKILINCLAAGSSFGYMFISNFIGQRIIDHNNNIFATAYKVQWYTTSLYIQRLIIILLQRGNKSFGLRLGGLFVASIESFAMVNRFINYIFFLLFNIFVIHIA
ncbi:uncharacterized protein [Cardiocondyla obscurior]|uniref:uncharacterized protein n=1 Tax=Cardiocondyla obscurior TaxID=286306 RepID=UPI0039656A17